MKNQLRYMRTVMYRMKRDYGSEIGLYHRTEGSVDYTTGRKETSHTVVKIKRAIVLPAKRSDQFVYDLSFIAANKNFTYGGIFEIGLRQVIIDGRDLPKGYVWDHPNTYVIYNNERYEIQTVTDLTGGHGYFMIMKQTEGAPKYQDVDLTVRDRINVTGEST